MIKKTLKYKNFDGETVSEEFYFNLSMGDILEKAADDKAVADLMEIAKGTDQVKMIKTFTDLISQSVGRRGGMGLIKSPEFSSEFMQSDAFSVLMWEILTDAKAASEFVNGLFPADITKKLAESGALESFELPKKKLEDYTRKELLAMSKEEFDSLTERVAPQNMSPEVLAVAFMRRQAGK